MQDWKSFMTSRTVWANLVGVISLALTSLGLDGAAVEQDRLVEAALQTITGLSFLASTVFRVTATRKLSL